MAFGREEYIEEYKKIPLFAGIKEEKLKQMLKCLGAYVRTYQADEYLILQENQVHVVGVILRGTVEMINEDLWGNRSVLTILNERELFGETFVCGGEYAAASFCAATQVTVLFLPFDKVLHTCNLSCVFHHRMIENMVTLIAQKNTSLMKKLEIVSKKTLREKIFTYLESQAKKEQNKYFTIPLGRVALAEYLGVDRSALTRELNYMRDDGFIDFEKNTFHILCPFES